VDVTSQPGGKRKRLSEVTGRPKPSSILLYGIPLLGQGLNSLSFRDASAAQQPNSPTTDPSYKATLKIL